MGVTRGEIAQRCLLLRCPNCGAGGQLKSWFHLRGECPACGLKHGNEDGFTLGTTSIGYVVALVVAVVPAGALVVMKVIPPWAGIVGGIAGSALVAAGLYPLFLGWVLMTYYVSNAENLPANKKETDPTRR